MFRACTSCKCLTLYGTNLKGNFVCDYCAVPHKIKVKEEKKSEPDYPTFVTEFKKQWPTKSAFAKFYKLKANTVQVALRPNKATKATKMQRRIYTILIRRGFGQLLILDNIITIEDFITVASEM